MSNRTRPTVPPVRRRPPPREGRGLQMWLPAVVLAAVVIVVLAIVVVTASRGDDDIAFGQVDYIGERLPTPPEVGVDPAVGGTAAVVRGFGPDGAERTFGNGSPRALMFVAHWCPHCEDEIDSITAWLDAGNELPATVDIQVVATWTDRARPNYPPGDWLADNGWDHPTILDNEEFFLASSFGLAATPMWIFIDSDGTIVARTGSLGPEQLAGQMAALVS